MNELNTYIIYWYGYDSGLNAREVHGEIALLSDLLGDVSEYIDESDALDLLSYSDDEIVENFLYFWRDLAEDFTENIVEYMSLSTNSESKKQPKSEIVSYLRKELQSLLPRGIEII